MSKRDLNERQKFISHLSLDLKGYLPESNLVDVERGAKFNF